MLPKPGTWVGRKAKTPPYSHPTAHIPYTAAIATIPFTSVTPPNETSADRSGILDSDVHTQK